MIPLDTCRVAAYDDGVLWKEFMMINIATRDRLRETHPRFLSEHTRSGVALLSGDAL